METEQTVPHQLKLVLLQVGTLDTLVGLSDDLGKLDAFVERQVADNKKEKKKEIAAFKSERYVSGLITGQQ